MTGEETNERLNIDFPVMPWRLDFHCPTSDGDGIRLAYEGEESKGTPPAVCLYHLTFDADAPLEDNRVTEHYIGQTDDLAALGLFLLNAARACQQTGNRYCNYSSRR